MATIESVSTTVERPGVAFEIDEAQLAAVSFLARYSGRTLEAYRHDLLGYFQWASDNDLAVLTATRPHLELFRAWMEGRGLAASTIDRRLSTVCGFYRFAHIDGRIGSNPGAVRSSTSGAPDRRARVGPVGARCIPFHSGAVRPRPRGVGGTAWSQRTARSSEACATNIEDLGFERGHRTRRIIGKGNKPATIPLVPRTARTIDLAVGERCEGPILQRRDGQRLDRRTAHRWVRSIGKRAGLGVVHPTCSEQPSSWLPSTRACCSGTCNSPPATPIPERPRSTTVAARTSTATPPTQSSPSSPAAERGDRDRHMGDAVSVRLPWNIGTHGRFARRGSDRRPGPWGERLAHGKSAGACSDTAHRKR